VKWRLSMLKAVCAPQVAVGRDDSGQGVDRHKRRHQRFLGFGGQCFSRFTLPFDLSGGFFGAFFVFFAIWLPSFAR
jgi:hypothetical protein